MSSFTNTNRANHRMQGIYSFIVVTIYQFHISHHITDKEAKYKKLCRCRGTA